MPEDAWNTEWTRSMAVMLNGKTLQVADEEGNPLVDDSFLIMVNASHEGVEFTLPAYPNGSPWRQVMDTENIDDPFKSVSVGAKVIVGGRSMMVFSDRAAVLKELQRDGDAAANSKAFPTPQAPSSSPPS
jgi:glycogen operon protein